MIYVNTSYDEISAESIVIISLEYAAYVVPIANKKTVYDV